MSAKNIKELFVEYYLIYDEQKKSELIKTATIVLDTNVLLNFYRWSKNTSIEFLKILEQIKERIWIPYQVLSEFFQRRLNVIEEKRSKLNEIIKEIDKIIKKLEEQREFKSYNFKKEKKIFIKAQKSILNKIESDLPNKNNDWIFETITNLFEGKHGQPFSEEEYNKIIEEGEVRYKQEIPPGYKDDNNKFGDLLIWKEIIFYAKENKKDVIFITDDQKEDWWWLDNKKQKISPRIELIREFYNETGQLFWMYTSHRFSDAIKPILKIPDKEALEKAIEEMKETKRKENIYLDKQLPFEKDLMKQFSKGLLEQIQKQQLDQIRQLQEMIPHQKLLEQIQRQYLDPIKQLQDLVMQTLKQFQEQINLIKNY